ncbi:MAG TPA: phosphate ABC transporter substrate-binding protein, partial [Candidatus Ozemobacteraceae bacterium]|nr:phosphate ABC transporter substrate-binding protein [Candidatus Ozemobacteraceae bacterium]
LGALNDSVRAVSVEGVTPTFESVREGKYRLVRPFYLIGVEPPAGDAADLTRFSLGSEAAVIMQKEGLVGVFR